MQRKKYWPETCYLLGATAMNPSFSEPMNKGKDMKSKILIALLALGSFSCSGIASASFIFGDTNSGTAQDLILSLSGGGTATLSTSQHEFTPGTDNQGWWSPNSFNFNSNDNIIVGGYAGYLYNDFFTFYLPNNLPVGSVTGATLRINDTGSSQGPFPVTYSLYDVSTPAATLNNNAGTSTAIYNDLGSGVQYASVGLGAYPSSPFNVALNANALTNINQSFGGYFSIGGTLNPSSVPVPEPSILGMFGLGLAMLGGLSALRRRQA